MAHLNDDRGQLILIAGLALAVIFVALAIISNSAIYTENLASRGETSGSNDALLMHHELQDNAGEVILTVNRYNYTSPDRGDSLAQGIDDLDEALGVQSANNGRLLTVEYQAGTTEDGTRVWDTDPGGSTFVDVAGNEQWTLTSGQTQARQFEMSLKRADIDSSDDVGTVGGWSDNFIINVTSSSDTYQIHIGEDSGQATLVVVEGDKATSFSRVGTCSLETAAPEITIDISEGVANGRPCEPLDEIWTEISGDYEIAYNHANQVTGNYSVTLDDSIVIDINLDDKPSYTGAVYETTLVMRYDTPSLTYETEVRVAPGEPRD